MDMLVDAIAAAVAEELKPLLEMASVKPRLLTVEQAGIYVGRTPNAVRILLSRGAFPAVKADARTMLDVQDLDRWIDQGKN
ncbi:MAG: helix-turn-helix domain-containing protein [Bryobacteraceae bacterium]